MSTVAQISQELKGTTYVIHMIGEIDVSNLPELEGTVNPLASDTSANSFILDCNGLEFIDSKVVGYMAYLYSTLSRSQKKLMIVGANSTISDILTLVGLNSIIPIFPTTEEALKSLNQT